MRIVDTNVAHYYSLHPMNYSFVDRIAICQKAPPINETYDLTLEIILRNDAGQKLYLSFSGVRDLNLNQGNSLLMLSSLEIRSVKDDQWEEIKYKVMETEDEMLSFYCRDFSARLMPEDIREDA